MSGNGRRNAFSIIEVLIISIVLTVLAVTIVPQFLSFTSESKDGLLKFNLHKIRSQIEMYKVHHMGKVPAIATFADQMTKQTDVNGATIGTNRIFGPYLASQVPANPFNNSNAVAAVATAGKTPTCVIAGGAGWQYDETTGRLFPNNPEYFQTRP